MCEDGLITEHSIGYTVIKDKKADNGDHIITEVLLWEGSGLQGWGANMNTPVTGIKSTREDLQIQIANFEKALKNGTYSDQVFKQIEIKLKSIQDAFQSITLLTDEPEKSTQSEAEPNYKEEILNILKSSFSF